MLNWQEKGLLLDNTSLTVSELIVLLSRKCAFGSTCSINRNEEGRKEGRKEERDKVDVSLKKLSCIACIYFLNQGESCPADKGLCLCMAELHQFQCRQVKSPWLFPASIQRFSIPAHGSPLQSPAAAEGGFLALQLTGGPWQGCTLQGCRRYLPCICLVSEEEREPAPASEMLCNFPAIGGGILAQAEAEGSRFCQTSGVQNGVAPCAPYSPLAPVQQSGVA